MTPEELLSIVTIIAVGCDHYEYLTTLSKVREDLNRFKQITCDSKYSVYKESQYRELYDGTSTELREMIQNYLFERSADQDILILFFSGHGTAIGRDDFGFCMKDAILHPEDNVVLPTSVVKLSEIIGTLRIKDVSLVLIVDSCYSGMISKAAKISFANLSGEMSSSLVASSGNLFGLITSCTDLQQTKDIGVISKALQDICEQGTASDSPYINLGQLSEDFAQIIDNHAGGDSTSRVFIPSGRIYNIPIAENIQYFIPPEPVNVYSFTNPYFKILLELWNDGSQIALSPSEILVKTGSASAYGNHKKLSLSSWDLVTDNNDGKRILTQRGIDFINGKLDIPKTIIENKVSRICKAAEGTLYLRVIEDTDLFGNTTKMIEEFER